MIGNGDIPLTNYWLIKLFYLRLWFSLKKKKISALNNVWGNWEHLGG